MTKKYQASAFSILLPSWNNLEYLQLCVESIRNHSSVFHQIIVHINEGSDGTLDWVRSREDLDYSYSENNQGICFALNQASEQAETNYICYFNDDMYALPGWDTELINEIRELNHSKFFFSATMIEPFEGKNNCVIRGKNFGTNPKEFNKEGLLSSYSTFPKANWSGASWPPNVVHIDLWKKVGGYSMEFSPGLYSDPDFSMKLWQEGVRIFKGVAKSRVYHFGSKSLNRIKMNDGRKTFKKKWGITPSFFDANYLHKGQEYQGELGKNQIWFRESLNRLKVFLGL